MYQLWDWFNMLGEATVRLLVVRGCTHKEISDYYQTLYPNTRGYSERSISRFCSAYNIRKICDVEIDSFVENFISLDGHWYGRSMTQGSISYTLGISNGIVSQRRYKGHMDQNEKICSGIRLHACGFDRWLLSNDIWLCFDVS